MTIQLCVVSLSQLHEQKPGIKTILVRIHTWLQFNHIYFCHVHIIRKYFQYQYSIQLRFNTKNICHLLYAFELVAIFMYCDNADLLDILVEIVTSANTVNNQEFACQLYRIHTVRLMHDIGFKQNSCVTPSKLTVSWARPEASLYYLHFISIT